MMAVGSITRHRGTPLTRVLLISETRFSSISFALIFDSAKKQYNFFSETLVERGMAAQFLRPLENIKLKTSVRFLPIYLNQCFNRKIRSKKTMSYWVISPGFLSILLI